MVGTIRSVLVVGMNDGFRVAVCIEGVTEFFEFFAEFAVVVNLAVENYPGGAVLIVNGLLPTLQVDYREAAHAKTHRAIDVEAIIIRPTMPDGSAHPAEECLVNV
jgi:hypothetical protein